MGVGIGAFVPHDDGFPTRVGARVIAGMEGSGERWTVGPEIEFDLSPGHLDRFRRKDLLPNTMTSAGGRAFGIYGPEPSEGFVPTGN